MNAPRHSQATQRPAARPGPSDDGSEETRAAPALHHVNLKTTRRDEMVSWYSTVLGMTVIAAHPMVTFLSNDTANHRLALFHVPGLEVQDDRSHRDGLHHMGFELPTFALLHQHYLRLRAQGIRPHMGVDHGISLSYYYADPDGNLVELQCDAHGDWGRSTQYLRDEADRQFIAGAVFDPAAVDDAVADGVPFATIHERALRGELSNGVLPDLMLPPPPDPAAVPVRLSADR